jgi:hypothetical protein
VKFWDSSALVPLVIRESKTIVVERLLAADDEVVAWWGTIVECVSAVARLDRSGKASQDEIRSMLGRLERLQAGWQEIAPTYDVRAAAQRLLRVHPLRSSDALQLAAATAAAGRSPQALQFISFDTRLRTAAQREGFPVVDI